MDLPDLGHAKAGNLQHVDEPGWHLVAQVLEQRRPAARDQLEEDLQRGRTNALRRRERTVGQGGSSPGNPATVFDAVEGANPEGILALELEEGRDLLEHLRALFLSTCERIRVL
jgi:hypothetical protein